jgi:hypothetical protein
LRATDFTLRAFVGLMNPSNNNDNYGYDDDDNDDDGHNDVDKTLKNIMSTLELQARLPE